MCIEWKKWTYNLSIDKSCFFLAFTTHLKELQQFHDKKYTVMSINEGTQLADYMYLIIQLPTQSISLTLSMQKSKYTTYCTLTLKYSNCPVVLALFGFSASVKCYCWSLAMSSHTYFIINPIKQTAWTSQYCSKAWCYFQYATVDLVMGTRTVRRITCSDGVFKCCKVQPMFQFSWNLTEASKQCCLCSLSSVPLPGPSGLVVRASAWLVFRRSLVNCCWTFCMCTSCKLKT